MAASNVRKMAEVLVATYPEIHFNFEREEQEVAISWYSHYGDDEKLQHTVFHCTVSAKISNTIKVVGDMISEVKVNNPICYLCQAVPDDMEFSHCRKCLKTLCTKCLASAETKQIMITEKIRVGKTKCQYRHSDTFIKCPSCFNQIAMNVGPTKCTSKQASCQSNIERRHKNARC